MDSTTLEEIFTGDAPAEAPAETPVEAPVVEAEPKEEAPAVVETEPKTEDGAPAVVDEPDSKMVPHQALHEERTKRQDAEKGRLDLEKRFNALTEQVGALLPHLSKLGGKEAPAEAPKLDFYTDPQAFVTQMLADLEQRTNQSLGSTLMAISEQQARGRHDDFDETLEAFAELTKDKPEIRANLRSVPDPAEWAYTFAKRAKAIQEIGDDPTAYEKTLRAKWEAEQAAASADPGAGAEPASVPNLPKSLANARNVGAGKRSAGPGWQGPTSLDAAFSGAPGRAKK